MCKKIVEIRYVGKGMCMQTDVYKTYACKACIYVYIILNQIILYYIILCYILYFILYFILLYCIIF